MPRFDPPPTPAPWRLTYLRPLDGLRAVAVILVLLVHSWSSAFPGGGIGVEVFFVLSGFLITSLLLTELSETGRVSLRRFYARRALRLFPALLTFVAAVVIYCQLTGTFRESALPDAPYVLLYVSNWTRAAGGRLPLFGHTWSLSVEEQFYLLWPVVLLLCYRRWRLAGVLTAAVLGVLLSTSLREVLLSTGATQVRIDNGFDTRAYMLLGGCAASAVLFLGWRPQPGPLKAAAAAGAGLVAAAVAFHPVRVLSIWGSSSLLLLLGIVAMIYLLALLPHSAPARLLSIGPLVYLGRISYGIYLWHFPMAQLGHRAALGEAHAFALVLAGSIICAALSFHLIERPLLRLRPRAAPAATQGAAPHTDEPQVIVLPEARRSQREMSTRS